MSSQVLIVDDDPQIREILEIALGQAGFRVTQASDGAEALEVALRSTPDLIVLDIGLPEKDGFEVCRELRKSLDVPILFLTARDDEIDRVLGFELGGDDYVTKPFSPRELVSRVKAILKRTAPVAPSLEVFRHGAIEVDPQRHLCRIGPLEVALTSTEMSILERLMRHPDHVVTRAQLVDAVYGNNIHVSDRTVDSHIRNLRSKLRSAGLDDAIRTLHGIGIGMGPCVIS